MVWLENPGDWGGERGANQWATGNLDCGRAGLRENVTWRTRKLRMQIFHGEDPGGWIFRSERYFELNNFSESEKLMEARVSMEGDALAWFQGEDARRPF